MKFLYPLLFLALALTFTSCVEEENLSQFETDFELPDNPVDLTRTDANELVGLKFGMADITLSNDDAFNNTNFSMIGCVLSVSEAGTPNNPALTELDESGSSFGFGNTIQADPLVAGQNTITFSRVNDAPRSGEWSSFLESDVFPIIADAPLAVSRVGDDLVVKCSICPITYNGVVYNSREVRLSLVD